MEDFEVIFMDAGQGDCTLIVYPDDSLTLVDCGSTKSGSHAFEQIKVVLERYMNKNTQSDIHLVLTHPDEDHYNLLHNVISDDNFKQRLKYVYYGGDIELYKNKKDNCVTYKFLCDCQKKGWAGPPTNSFSKHSDNRLSRGGVNVTILAANCTGKPNAGDSKNKNANSIVLLVEYKGAKVFLMGDAFTQTEKFITENCKKTNCLPRLKKSNGEHVVLKMGHHGSDTSTSKDWVELIEPEVLVVSSGTKIFRGKGMPTDNHLESTINNTDLSDTGINQSYVVFDESNQGNPGKDFKTKPKTQKAIWTTCYCVKWPKNGNRWIESGQTWYYGVNNHGNKSGNHWIGYTGY